MITSRMVEAFRAVILNGSISEAAGVLNISQPAVSRLIKDLEVKIGFRLFDRRHGRVFANDDALAFYQEVHRAYIGMNRITLAAEQIKKRERGVLRVACMPAIGLSIMPRVIANFQKTYPGINIYYQVVRSGTIMQFLTSLKVDIGFVESSFTAPSVDEGQVYHLDSVCVLPPGHPLGSEKVIRPEHLAGEPFISFDADSMTRYNIDAIFKAAGVERQLRIEAPLSNALCSLVLEGCGVSIVEPMTAQSFAHQGIIVRPFRPKAIFSFRGLNSSRISGTSLISEFNEVFNRVLNENLQIA